MAVTLFLKKQGKNDVKIGVLGFSWTTFFFGLFVPLLRKDFKLFLPLFILYIGLFAGVFYMMPYTFSDMDGMQSLEMTDDFGLYNAFSTAFYFIINIVGAFVYNKIYTQGLVNKSYLPVASEGTATLKAYGIKFPQDFDEDEIEE